MKEIKSNDINYKSFETSSHSGATCNLYLNDNKIYKIFKKSKNINDNLLSNYDLKNLLILFRKMNNLEHPNIVKPEELLVKKNLLIGYSSIYYKEYSNLFEKLYRSKEIDVNYILKITSLASKVLKYFHDNDYTFNDFSYGNILVNENDEIKIIDLDSCSYKDDLSYYVSQRCRDYFENYLDTNVMEGQNIDCLSLFLEMLYFIFGTNIQNIKKYDYDKLCELSSTLKELKPYYKDVINGEYLDIPYLDDVIKEEKSKILLPKK